MHHGAERLTFAIVCALLVAAAGCGYPTVSHGVEKACDLGFQPIKPIVTGKSVLGQLAVVCDVPPQRHDLRMWLEHRPRNADWHARNELFSDEIPGRMKTIHQLLAPCQPGRWRIRVHVTGSLDGNPFEFTDKSIERLVGDHECK